MSRVWVRTGIGLSVSQKYPHLKQEPRDLAFMINKEAWRDGLLGKSPGCSVENTGSVPRTHNDIHNHP